MRELLRQFLHDKDSQTESHLAHIAEKTARAESRMDSAELMHKHSKRKLHETLSSLEESLKSRNS